MSGCVAYRSVLAGLVAAMLLAPAVARADFGIMRGSFTAGAFQSDGVTPDTQAGDHPYEATTSFELNTDARGVPEGRLKDVIVDLPPGFVGDPNATPQCPQATFLSTTYVQYESGKGCPDDTVVGEAEISWVNGINNEGLPEIVGPVWIPVFNMAPSRGQLAVFAFNAGPVTALIDISVRTAGDYGVTAKVSNIVGPAIVNAGLTLWGVPADPGHDPYRGHCLKGDATSSGNCPSDAPPRPFLTNPSRCDGHSLTTTLSVDSYEGPGVDVTAGAVSPPVTGCDLLSFDPSLGIAPETSQVDTPSGYSVDLGVPQNTDPYGLATPDLKDAAVALPSGVAISPAAADALQACNPAQIGIGTEAPPSCPDASKLGTVRISSPSLPRSADGSEGNLNGFLYLGEPASGPIVGPPYSVYLDAQGYGLDIKLAGRVSADPVTGQLTTTFNENPPLPFDHLALELFGGPRAALNNPLECGTYWTSSQLTPFSSATAATPSPGFTSSWDGLGSTCPSPLPFAPSFVSGTTSTVAGGFTSFVLNIERGDRQQLLSGVSLSMPPGLLGMLSHVPLCQEPWAAQGTCDAASRIGTVTAGAGSGPDPFHLSGPVYLTGPYRGAPFGLSIVVPAVAGPFDLGDVVVRSAISIDPRDAHLVVASDPLPQMVGQSGIPVALHSVSVDIDRPGFVFNPTSCAPMAVAGTLRSNRGTDVSVSSPFQASGCTSLAFNPTFTVSTQAKTSKASGASLDVRVASQPGQANIGKVDVQLPKALPSRLTTLQKACTEVQFAADPAGCPSASVVGIATAITPTLNVPLIGPAYLVAHGGAAFPDLVVVLQGEGITIKLVGNTAIKRGVTYSKFDTLPDAPISSFELKLPESPHSALAAYGSLCGSRLVMPTTITAQSGAQIKQATRIRVTGCATPHPRRRFRSKTSAKQVGNRHRKAGR
jgi:hypothetical protein